MAVVFRNKFWWGAGKKTERPFLCALKCLNSLWTGRLAAWVLCCLLKILLLVANVIGRWVPSPEQWVCLFAPLRICFAGYWVPLCNALPSMYRCHSTHPGPPCVCVEGGGRVDSSVADPLAVRTVDGVWPRGRLSSACTIVFCQVRFPVLEDLRHFTLFDSIFLFVSYSSIVFLTQCGWVFIWWNIVWWGLTLKWKNWKTGNNGVCELTVFSC